MADQPVTVTLPSLTCQRLIERAQAAGCTVSELVRRMVEAEPGQPDVVAALTTGGVPAVVWYDGPVGGTCTAPVSTPP